MPLAVGEDFDGGRPGETYLAVRCRSCEATYLSLRPVAAPAARRVRSFCTDPVPSEADGFLRTWRRRSLAGWRLRAFANLAPNARILEIGRGDRLRLGLLREFGPTGWGFEDAEARSSSTWDPRSPGLMIHQGAIEELDLPPQSCDAVLLLGSLEEAREPAEFLRTACSFVTPGGRLVLVTGNTDSVDFRVFGSRHWGGYHFPRCLYLFDPRSLSALVRRAGLVMERVRTIRTPVHWITSLRNLLVDWKAPPWCLRGFARISPLAYGLFRILDSLLEGAGQGALIEAVVRRPREKSDLVNR